MNFKDFQKAFPNEEAVVKKFIEIRYNRDTPICNHCGSEKVSARTGDLKKYQCNSCNNSFSIFTDTIFEKTTTDLVTWMYAIYLFLNAKKGISALQLMRDTGVTYKTAWRMLKQIRMAMGNVKNKEAFGLMVEIDETYVGGKPRKPNEQKKDKDKTDEERNKRGRGTKKNPVVGVVDRESNTVHAKVMLPNEKDQKLTGKQLLEVINEVCKSPTTVYTDQFPSYDILSQTHHIRIMVDHREMFMQGEAGVNRVESFWANLKRAHFGTYHHMSLKYLQSYVNEFCFRWNNRNKNMFNILLRQSIRENIV